MASSTHRSAQYNLSKFLRLKNIDINQDWVLGLRRRGFKINLLPKPQYIKKVSIIDNNEDKDLENYLFFGKIKDTKMKSSKTKIHLDLIENSSTDTIVKTTINNISSCEKYNIEPVTINFKTVKTS